MVKRVGRFVFGGAVVAWKVWAYSLGLAAAALIGYLGWEAWQLAKIWPDFDALATGEIPKSRFILNAEREKVRVAWRPVPLENIDHTIVDAVVLAEDVRFWDHLGVDLSALGEAIEHNWKEGELDIGGSTISQQTVKNLFLSRERTFRRKGIELLMTLAMERRLGKERILEIYLNVAQLGPTIYGVEAATQAYFGKSATDVSDVEAAGLAASLPSPAKHNPGSNTAEFQRRRNKILWFMAGVYNPPRQETPPQLQPVSAPTEMTSVSRPITSAVIEATTASPAFASDETADVLTIDATVASGATAPTTTVVEE